MKKIQKRSVLRRACEVQTMLLDELIRMALPEIVERQEAINRVSEYRHQKNPPRDTFDLIHIEVAGEKSPLTQVIHTELMQIRKSLLANFLLWEIIGKMIMEGCSACFRDMQENKFQF